MILYNISKFQPIRRNSFLRIASLQLPWNHIAFFTALCIMYYCSAVPGGPASPGGLRLAAPAGAQRCPEYPLPYSPPKGYLVFIVYVLEEKKLDDLTDVQWKKRELSLGRKMGGLGRR